ncbi:T9SS type A sorting domain-containing protein [Bacteroidota bacterium]
MQLSLSSDEFAGEVILYCTVTDDSLSSAEDSISVTINDTDPPPGTENISNNFNNENILLYPNPSNEEIYIDLKEPGIQNVSYELIDINGEIIMQGKLLESILNVSDLGKGIYIFKLYADELIITEKIMIE